MSSAFGRTALLCGVSFLVAMGSGVGTPAVAQSVRAGHDFNIAPKPLLAALADFTAQTGIQVVRPSAQRVAGSSPGVSGRHAPEAALRIILSGSGLAFHASGPNTVTLYAADGGDESGFVPAGDAVLLDTIDVSGAGRGMSAHLGGVGTVNISPGDLARGNPMDLQDVFAGEPAVSVGSSLPMSQKVYVHGVEETNLAVTLDGGRQNNKVFHHNATNLIDPSLLKQVTVDAGVAPADAGPGALAGAIAYETKNARDLLLPGKNFGGFGKISFDTNSTTMTTGTALYGIHEGLEILGYVNYGHGDEHTDGDGREVTGTGTDFVSGVGKVAYEAASGDRFELSHDRIRDDAPRPFRANIGQLTNRPNQIIRDYTLERQNTVFKYTDASPEGWWDPKIILAYGGTRVDVPETERSVGETDSFNGRIENRFALAFGSVTAGFDFYKDEASYKGISDTAAEKADNIGLYAQARLEPWERTRLSFGARADHQWFEGTSGEEFDNSGLSGNVSAEYDITDWLTAKAGYSHVWGGVMLTENFVMNSAWLYGESPDPTVADNVVAGLVVTYEGFSFEGGVFRTRIDNIRDTVWAAAPGNPLVSRDLESEGFELAAAYNWGDGFFKIAYTDTDILIDGVPADSDTGNYIATPIGQMVKLTGAHFFADWGVTVGGDVQIVFEYDKLPAGSNPLPAYEVVNIFAEYTPVETSNLTFRVEVNNLFDETYADRATYGQEFPNVIPLREAGRSFLLSAKAQF